MNGPRKLSRNLSIATAALLIVAAAYTLGRLGEGGVGSSLPSNPFSPGIVLAAPAELPRSFDSGPAGITAYLNTGSQIDITALEPLGTVLDKKSSRVLVALSEVNAILYADTGGWLVAYLPRGATNKMARWFPQTGDLKPFLRSSNRLNESLEKAVETVGLDWDSVVPNVGYTHFGYPSATRLVFFSKGTYGNKESVSFNIPATHTLYEATWSSITSDYDSGSCFRPANSFALDGGEPQSVHGGQEGLAGTFLDLSLGTQHTLELLPCDTTTWMGVAVYLVLE